jgi:lactoylglutathione lyase
MMIMKAKFEYTGIRVTDVQKSVDFYTKVLGMKILGRQKMEQTKGETVGLSSQDGSFVLELNHYDEGSPYNTEYAVGEGLDHLGFKVDDLDTALKEVQSSGYETILEIKTDGSRYAYIEDPNGIWIELY